MSLTYAISLAIILWHDFTYKEVNPKVGRACRQLMTCSILFCLQDALWGYVAEPIGNDVLLFACSTIFFSTTALMAYMWLNFVLVYLGHKVLHSNAFRLIGLLVVIFQMFLVIRNFFTPTIFSVAADHSYIVEPYRKLAFFTHYFSYIVIGLIALMAWITDRGRNRGRYSAVMIFVLAPILCGWLQLRNPAAPFLSVGFFLGCSVIHVFVLSREHDERMMIASNTDELTKLFNRHAFVRNIDKYKDRPIEDDFILFSIDVNGLKQVNDSLGHRAGDELICGAASCIKKAFSEGGKVFRVGGDEFFAAVRSDDDGYVFKKRLEEEAAQWQGKLVKELTLSVGFAEKSMMPGANLPEMEIAADQMMYREKDLYYKSKGIDRRACRG